MNLNYWTLSAALLTSVIAGQSVGAQGYYPYPAYPYPAVDPNVSAAQSNVVRSNLSSRFGEIQTQINTAVSNGQLSPAEASNLMAEMSQISSQVDMAASTGALAGDTSALVATITVFAQKVSSVIAANTNAMAPYQRYGYNNGYLPQRRLNTLRNNWNVWR